MNNLLRNFGGSFPNELPRNIPPKRTVNHEIDLEPGYSPPSKPPYWLSQARLDELQTQLSALRECGFNEPSKSPFGAPVFFVRKSDGSLRLVCDWRELYCITIKNEACLPNVDDLFDTIQGSKYFTKLDLHCGLQPGSCQGWGCPQDSNQHTPGTLRVSCHGFGLCNAPATFQSLMNDILRSYLRKFIVVFLDNILIFSKTWENHLLPWTKKRTNIEIRGEKNAVPRVKSCSIRRDQRRACPIRDFCPALIAPDRAWFHTWNSVLLAVKLNDGSFFLSRVVEHVREIMEVLQRNQLFCKPSKCVFGATEILYLGYFVSGNSIRPDPKKLAAVEEWPVPESITQVRSFLGFGNYFRRFIPRFAEITQPLDEVTGRHAQFSRNKKRQDAFDSLKSSLLCAPALQLPDVSKPFRLHTDASDVAIAAVLEQERDSAWHRVAYTSWKLTSVETNYTIAERETLAVVFALTSWKL